MSLKNAVYNLTSVSLSDLYTHTCYSWQAVSPHIYSLDSYNAPVEEVTWVSDLVWHTAEAAGLTFRQRQTRLKSWDLWLASSITTRPFTTLILPLTDASFLVFSSTLPFQPHTKTRVSLSLWPFRSLALSVLSTLCSPRSHSFNHLP